MISGEAGISHSSSPYHNLLKSLLTVASSQGKENVKWVVIGNDHTFMIPQNLAEFLNTLDADALVYTGNELKMQYRRRVLSFASGGAGAVMSHVVVKLMLLVWFLTTNDPLLTALLPSMDGEGPHRLLQEGGIPAQNWSSFSLHWGSHLSVSTKSTYRCSFTRIAEITSCGDDAPMLDLRRSGPHLKCVLAFLRIWMAAGDADLSALHKSLGADKCHWEHRSDPARKVSADLFIVIPSLPGHNFVFHRWVRRSS
jgi:hypothetical protein